MSQVGTSTLCTVDEERVRGNNRQNSKAKQTVCKSGRPATNAVLDIIKRTLLCKSKELILQLYKSLIRPKLN